MKILEHPFRAKEEIIRGVALQVFLLSVVALITQSIIPLIVLFADFSIRVFINPIYSPLVFLSRILLPITKFRKRFVVFKPKRFAAGIGMFMSLLALAFLINDKKIVAIIIISILSLFSFLESFFKFCAGCKIFGLLIKFGFIAKEECTDCVFQEGGGI